MEPYTYRPLSGPQQIRMMILEPAIRLSAPIHCILKHQDLDEEPFEALSYVWGSTEDLQTLHCQGKNLQIKKNLDKALRDIRKRRHKMRIWVDAVCINQSDMDEKSVQIKLMTQIYTKAKHCVIWLDPAEKQSRYALRAMKAMHALIRPFGHKRLAFFSTRGSCYRYILRYVFFIDQRGVQTLDNLCTCEWFYRLWTFQELLLNKAPRVLYRRYSVSWDALRVAECCLSSDGKAGARRWRFSCWTSFHKLADPNKKAHDATTLTWQVERLLLGTRRLQSSYPADKVIGALAIFERVLGHSLALDYSYSVTDLYSTLSRMILARFKDLQFLLSAAIGQRTLGLPSWCIDWNYRPEGSRFVFHDYRHACAARGEDQSYDFSGENSSVSELCLEGFVVGSITMYAGPISALDVPGEPTTSESTTGEGTRDRAVMKWMTLLRCQASNIENIPHQLERAGFTFAYPDDSFVQGIPELLEASADREVFSHVTRKYKHSVWFWYLRDQADHDSLVIMDNGHIGRCFCPVGVAAGDMIFQPAGETSLIVLRPVHEREGFYRYLGMARVHGLKQYKESWDTSKPDYCCDHRIELGEEIAITLV